MIWEKSIDFYRSAITNVLSRRYSNDVGKLQSSVHFFKEKHPFRVLKIKKFSILKSQ